MNKVTDKELEILAELVGTLIGENDSLKSNFKALSAMFFKLIDQKHPELLESYMKEFSNTFQDYLASTQQQGISLTLKNRQQLDDFLKKFGKGWEN